MSDTVEQALGATLAVGIVTAYQYAPGILLHWGMTAAIVVPLVLALNRWVIQSDEADPSEVS